MGAEAAVPWETCAQEDCEGARVSAGGDCLLHTAVEELADRSSTGRGVDVDGRGIRFDRTGVAKLLESVPVDEGGSRLFGTVRLDRAIFDKDVSFDDAEFAGEVSLVGAVFEGEARFGGATFLAGTDFGEATFRGQAWFVGARFAGPASFRSTTFAGGAWFSKTTFDAPATFDGALFSTNATFSSATFNRAASFSAATFASHVRFDRATCAEGWRLDGASFKADEDIPEGVAHQATSPTTPPPLLDLRDHPPPVRARRTSGRIRPAVLLIALALLAATIYIVVRPNDEDATFEDYAFLHRSLRTDLPARYNPCEPIRYVVNLDRSPPDFAPALDQALAEVTAATGIAFQNEGTTTEKAKLVLQAEETFFNFAPDTKGFREQYLAALGRPSYQPDRYGKDRWAPVLISWASFKEFGQPFSFLGIGASDPRDVGTNPVYVSGTVVLNSDAPDRDLKPTIMHELGHLVGLGHVNTRSELMSPTEEATTWGPGDLEGLRRVGRSGGCIQTPPPGPDPPPTP